MIALIRERIISVIPSKYRGKSKKNNEEKLLLEQRDVLNAPKTKITFDTNYWKAAKTQLIAESHGKCAYCEIRYSTGGYGDVEHFRPKSIYWWLAYTYENYLFSCQLCNQLYKKDKFPYNGIKFPAPSSLLGTTSNKAIKRMCGNISPDPINIKSGYTLALFLQHHVAEKALLINPYYEDPEPYFAYSADDNLKEVIVISPSIDKAPFTKEMIDTFGLNRKELKEDRYDYFQKFYTFKRFSMRIDLPPDVINECKIEIEEMKKSDKPFAGMVRFFDKVL